MLFSLGKKSWLTVAVTVIYTHMHVLLLLVTVIIVHIDCKKKKKNDMQMYCALCPRGSTLLIKTAIWFPGEAVVSCEYKLWRCCWCWWCAAVPYCMLPTIPPVSPAMKTNRACYYTHNPIIGVAAGSVAQKGHRASTPHNPWPLSLFAFWLLLSIFIYVKLRDLIFFLCFMW